MKTYADIAARARELHTACALPTVQWTLPLVCDHLAKAMTGSTGALGANPLTKSAPLYRRIAGRIVVLTFGYIPKGVPSPQRVMPQSDVTWEQAIQNLDDAVALCERKAVTGERWIVHPLIGFSDAKRWKRFHIIHARHHFGCLRAAKTQMTVCK